MYTMRTLVVSARSNDGARRVVYFMTLPSEGFGLADTRREDPSCIRRCMPARSL
jgi:hypothetical protein